MIRNKIFRLIRRVQVKWYAKIIMNGVNKFHFPICSFAQDILTVSSSDNKWNNQVHTLNVHTLYKTNEVNMRLKKKWVTWLKLDTIVIFLSSRLKSVAILWRNYWVIKSLCVNIWIVISFRTIYKGMYIGLTLRE